MWKIALLITLIIQTTRGQLIGQTRIAGGRSRQGIPWVASLFFEGKSFCGGALLSSKAVVTAAHCFVGDPSRQKHLTVVLGRGTDEKQKIQAKHVFVHEGFTLELFKYDVAVVRLARPVIVSSYARVARKQDYARAKVVGWGLLEYKGSKPKSMQQANVVIQPDHECLESLKFDPALSFCAKGYQFHESKFTNE
ncbi:Transmembrane protease serine 6 [Entomophthora muscae]|uniref:Transmembrane protease serine 6 n=1 Tax=Entomophthora muscae TaxID=34485 RepID=A0ACC2U5W2_9FUNG|nr:Transmembrane protease serine 6 [Entomophthora muscae]